MTVRRRVVPPVSPRIVVEAPGIPRVVCRDVPSSRRLLPVGAVPPLPVPSFSVTAQFSSAATLAAATLSLSRVAGFVSGGQLEAVVISVHQVAAQFGAAGSLGAAAEAVGGEFVREANFTGGGDLSAVRTVSFSRTAAFGTAGSFAAAAEAVENYARTAAFTSGATLSAVASEIEKGAAGFAGAGQLSVAVVPVHVVSAQFGGSGTLAGTASEIEQAAAALGGSGTLSATVKVSFTRAAAFSGGAGLSATGLAASLKTMKAVLSSMFTAANSATPVQLTPMVADTTAAPDSVVTSNAMVISGAGTGTFTVNARLFETNSGTATAHLRKNGTQIGPTYTNASGGTGAGAAVTDSFGGSFTASVANGDLITMWVATQGLTSNRRQFDPPADNWFRVTS